MQQGLKSLNEDEVYMLGMTDAQHQDLNLTGVLMVTCLILGFIVGIAV